MTRERAKELLPIITAYAEGKSLQFRAFGGDQWENIHEPYWSDTGEYRIKPEPREFWISEQQVYLKDKNITGLIVFPEIQNKTDCKHCIHVREVLD